MYARGWLNYYGIADVYKRQSVCSQYMKNLINLGLIRKETPYGEKESRKSIYAIADNIDVYKRQRSATGGRQSKV